MMNFDEILSNPNWKITIASLNQEHPRDACLRRVKETSLFFMTLFLLILAFLGCGYIIISNNFSTNDQKWATFQLGKAIGLAGNSGNTCCGGETLIFIGIFNIQNLLF